MISVQLAAALLLVGGGAVVLLSSQPRRADIRERLNLVDGVQAPSRTAVLRAVLAGATLLAVPLAPVVAVLAGLPALAAVVATLVVLPTVATIVAELRAGVRRSGMPWRVPLVASWQRRMVGALVARAAAPFPAPPLRRSRPRQRSRPPSLVAAGTGRRLLIVPPGSREMRLWDVAETYLGARSRYRDILSLNRGRRSPGGTLISEDSLIGPGWTLLVPRDAIGVGLVDLTGDPRMPFAPGGHLDVPSAPAGGVTPEEDLSAGDGDPTPETAEDLGSGPVPDVPMPPEHAPAELPWDLVHSRLLADGVRTLVAFHRRQREHTREPGSGVRALDPAAAAVDIAAELGADRAGAACLEGAIRLLPTPPPHVVAARLLPDRVEFVLAHPDPRSPGPFTADTAGLRWTLPRDDCGTAVTGGAGLPGLVSIGRDRAGWVLVDVLAARGIVALAGEGKAARMVATALALELVLKRWSDEMRVVMVGFDLPFDGLHPRLTVADRLDQVLHDLAGPQRDDTVGTPLVLVLAQPPTRLEHEVLRTLAERGGPSAVGVVVVGSEDGARWVWQLSPDGVLTCPQLGLSVGAHALSGETAAALASLVRAETGSGPDRAVPRLPRPVDPASTEVVVRLFGDPALDGPDGELEADSLTVEIVAFLALHGAAGPEQIAAAVFPFGVPEADLRAALKVVVDVLGAAPSGNPGLLEYDDGRLELTGDVHADWHLFVAFEEAGRSADALELLARVTPADRSGTPDGVRFSWISSVPLARALSGIVADAAHSLVGQRLAAARPDLAAVAASAGLRAEPMSRLLRDDLQQALRVLQTQALHDPVGSR